MPLEFLPIGEEHLAAVRAFNERMRGARAQADFLLPEEVPNYANTANGPIRWKQFVALDGENIRGGIIEMEQPAWLNGRNVCALNHQSALSEGLIDRSQAMLGWQMIRFFEDRGEAVFAVGMGTGNRWSQLLRKCEWSVRPIPFLFRVHRTGAFLRKLPMLHSTRARHVLASVALVTGMGPMALTLMQARRKRLNASIRRVGEWGKWADEIWQRVRPQCSFSIRRDRETLDSLYPSRDPRLQILLVEHGKQPVGWAVCIETRIKEKIHFGDLCVHAVLDCMAIPEAMADTAALADREMASRGADLVFVNHSYEPWVRAFRSAGFFSGTSNYQLAMSKSLTEAIRRQHGGEEHIHVTRGDGDGRCNIL